MYSENRMHNNIYYAFDSQNMQVFTPSLDWAPESDILHLHIACEVWSPHQAYLVDIDILEGVQRRATKVIIKHKPYGERLKDLKLLSLVSRRKYSDLIFLF